MQTEVLEALKNMLEELSKKSYYGEIRIKMEAGNIVQCKQEENLRNNDIILKYGKKKRIFISKKEE